MVEDVKREPLSYDRLITGACALARPLRGKGRRRAKVVGVLPSVNGVVAAFFALLRLAGRDVPVCSASPPDYRCA